MGDAAQNDQDHAEKGFPRGILARDAKDVLRRPEPGDWFDQFLRPIGSRCLLILIGHASSDVRETLAQVHRWLPAFTLAGSAASRAAARAVDPGNPQF